MATKAFILIETAVGKTREVANILGELGGMKSVDVVTGPYDIIAVIDAPDINTMGGLGHREDPHHLRGGTHGYLRRGRRLALWSRGTPGPGKLRGAR